MELRNTDGEFKYTLIARLLCVVVIRGEEYPTQLH